jgi:hypothetical protein
MNRKTIFFSLACITAMLFLPPVLLHATTLRVPNPSTALQDTADAAVPPVATEDIRDIYGPVSLPKPPPYLLYGLVILLAILLIGAIWFTWVFMKKRKNNQKIDPAVLALCSLKKAEDGLPEIGILFFAGEVSQILRSYIEARFSIPTTSCTTSEFFSSLETSFDGQSSVMIKHDDTLKQCLMLCDRIKFSRFLPEHEVVKSLAESVHSFIDKTRTKPAEER